MDAAAKTVELDLLAKKVIMPYIIMAAVLMVLAGLVRFSALPDVEKTDEDKDDDSAKNKTSILQFPFLWLGALAIFVYVGVEVIAGDTIIRYGISLGIPISTAKLFTSFTLASMVLGYITYLR